MRKIMMGMYDRGFDVGVVTGSGPGFAEAQRKYKARQLRQAERGTWRSTPASWKKPQGTFVDPDWYIIDWGQYESDDPGQGSGPDE